MKKYGLIAKYLGHSRSKELQGLIMRYANIDGEYGMYEIPPEDVGDFVLNLGKNKFLGINVTIPYKTDVMQYLDNISDAVKAIGAVNTIKAEKNKLSGHNTDYYGFTEALKHAEIDISGMNCFILGNGGTAKCLAYALKKLNVNKITVVVRRPDVIFDDAEIITYDELANRKDIGVILNATPVGTYPNVDSTPIPEKVIKKSKVCIDMTYNPHQTLFLKLANKNGVKTMNGLFMLIAQGIKAQEIFNDIEIDDDIAPKIYKDMLNNIAFIGMPGCGKTMLGKFVAEETGYNFIDCDEIFVEKYGAIDDFFDKYGEQEFRKKETEILNELRENNFNNTIISTGGGVVTKKENIDILSKYAKIVFIDRPIENIAEDVVMRTRPLLTNGISALMELYNKRYDLYNEYSEYVYKNTLPQPETKTEILKFIKSLKK